MFFKKRDIDLHCYTYSTAAADIFPISKTSHARIDAANTELKYCVGLQNLYKYGAVMPLWTDIKFNLGEVGNPYWGCFSADTTTAVTTHQNHQFGKVIDVDKYQNFKIESVWLFKCQEDIKFHSSPLAWSFEQFPEDIRILDGITDFKYQHSTNFIFLSKKENSGREFTLNCGTPLLQFLPLSERKLKIHVHLLSFEEWRQKIELSKRISFLNNYVQVKKFMGKFKK